MKFTNEVDYVEWIATTYGIIRAFEDRGYALYELGPGPIMFGSVAMIEEFIQFGRAEEVLNVGMRHMLLPLVKNSEDSFQVMKAVDEMVNPARQGHHEEKEQQYPKDPAKDLPAPEEKYQADNRQDQGIPLH